MKKYDDINEGEIYYTANSEDFWNVDSDSPNPDGILEQYTRLKLVDEDNPIHFEVLDGKFKGKVHSVYWWAEGAAKPEDYLTEEEYNLLNGKDIPKWRQEIKKVEHCPQRQDSLIDQMVDLYEVANQLGFYDAADFIKKKFVEK